MMRVISRRVLTASVPLVSLLIVLGVTVPVAQAVDEFATPRPSLGLKTKSTLATRAQEVYVLRAPDVVGQPLASARTMLERGRLQVGRETAHLTSEHRPGTVMSQDPKPGTPLQPGASVNLWVATPPRVAPVPGKPGLSLGDRRRQESDAAAGTVIAQSPAAGTRVKPGTSVDVTIAAPALVAVPDLTGETPREAARLLHRYQLGLGGERQRESEARPGTVIRQSPAAGTRVPRETAVNILVATAPVPPPAPYTPPAPPKPPVIVAPPVVVAPPAPPAPVVVTPPPAPITTAPPLPPTPPIVTPPAPSAPPAVAVAPPAPATVRKPAPALDVPPAPVSSTSAVVVAAPIPQPEVQPVPEPGKSRWPRSIAWSLGSIALLGAGGTAYYRVRMTNGAQPVPTVPTVKFDAHWDSGTQQIDAAAPLAGGSGLRLVAGVETATTTLETDHLVGAAHDNGGTN